MKYIEESLNLLDHLIEMSGINIPECVNDLIDSVVSSKAHDLEMNFFEENIYLPLPIQSINLTNNILSVNRKIENWSQRYNFSRSQKMDFSEIIDENVEPINRKYPLISNCLKGLSDDEYLAYKQYYISPEDLRITKNWYRRKYGKNFDITLPKFELITNYLALIIFYDVLVLEYQNSNSLSENKTTHPKFQFKTKLDEAQILKMYQGLIEGGFIDSNTDRFEFLWCFGIEKYDFSTCRIDWLKSQSLGVYFIDTLFSYNFLLNYSKMWAIGSKIFGFKNMAQTKQNYITTNTSNKPKGFESIDRIIDSL